MNFKLLLLFALFSMALAAPGFWSESDSDESDESETTRKPVKAPAKVLRAAKGPFVAKAVPVQAGPPKNNNP